MVDVYVAGVAQVRFGRTPERSLEGMGQQATLAAMRDAGVDKAAIDEVFCGNVLGGMLVGQRVLRDLGMTGGPISNVEAACSSGSLALREAYWALQSGRAETILVVGVEKMSVLGGGPLPLETTDIEVSQGQVMPAVYAMRARRYMLETGATETDLGMIAVKARANGALNPVAHFQKAVPLEEVLGSRMVADPLRLNMCCPTSDGGAAVVLTTRKPQNGKCPIRIAGTALQSGLYRTGPYDTSSADLTRRTSALAYEQAGVDPADVGLCELHDAFAIAELMYYEALGLCPAGDGAKLLRSGATQINGRLPVNPSGGLLSRGHALGATGLAQVAEAVMHMRREGGNRQVDADVKVAVTHCTGGGISGVDHGACAVTVLVR
ncbi:thiolase family protein [Oleispirillum naphthae]|uniref:thiolase family protein n=1 Tax=Oleispirillum naphthae TaxID=2838853 RepID=UPI0030825B0C